MTEEFLHEIDIAYGLQTKMSEVCEKLITSEAAFDEPILDNQGVIIPKSKLAGSVA